MLDVYDTILHIIKFAEEVSNNDHSIVVGKTSIEKMAYFVKLTCNNSEMPEFRPYFFGPYSSEVRTVLEDLVSYLFVDEKRVPGRRYDAYTYRLNDDGKTIIKDLKDSDVDAYNDIKELVERCYETCSLKSKPLSYASKIHYIINESDEDINIDDIKIGGKDLNWEIDDEDMEQGISLLKKLKLDKNERLFCS